MLSSKSVPATPTNSNDTCGWSTPPKTCAILTHQDSIQGLIIDGLCSNSDYYKKLMRIDGSEQVLDCNNNNEKTTGKRSGKVS